jgi:hypothetical protein
MAKKEKKILEKKNWSNSFVLIGEAKPNDYTYKLDEKSEKSDWIYNSLNLGVYCGETCGTVYAELMGGYGAERDNVVYVHGKDEDGKDDFDNRFTIDWDDRFDEEILESVGDLCFLTVGLEKDKNDKVYYKKFLTPYDMIAYINENLEKDMVVNVKGSLKYSMYNDNVQVKKEINSIVLSKVNDPSKYNARFTQTMLLTKDSVGKPDKDTGILPIYAKVLDYVKEYKGKEVRTNIPYNKMFEYELDLSNPELSKKVIDAIFKVKKGVTEVTFEGNLIEGGAVITATEDDLPDDIKALVSIGVFSLDEALAKCSVSSGREKRMVIRKPLIKMVEDKEGNKTPVIQKFEQKYDEDDLILDFMYETEDENDEAESDELPFAEEVAETVDANDTSWLDNL